VLCDFKLYLMRFVLTTGFLFDTSFFFGYKLCRSNHGVFEFESFSIPINW